MNSCTFIGRLTKDPEVYVGQQIKSARFSIAIDRGKDKNGNDRGADFPNIVCFGRTAEFAEKWLSKGQMVGITAHVQTGKYEKDGKVVYTTDFVVEKITMVDWGEKADKASTQDGVPAGFSQMTDDDVPF